jgi:hypothetical protein
MGYSALADCNREYIAVEDLVVDRAARFREQAAKSGVRVNYPFTAPAITP